MVEVFKTNISSKRKAKIIRDRLEKAFPEYGINFDLEDCDRILRVEAVSMDCESLLKEVKKLDSGISITILEG